MKLGGNDKPLKRHQNDIRAINVRVFESKHGARKQYMTVISNSDYEHFFSPRETHVYLFSPHFVHLYFLCASNFIRGYNYNFRILLHTLGKSPIYINATSNSMGEVQQYRQSVFFAKIKMIPRSF